MGGAWRMQIYLVQHGEFKSEEIDPERSLTESGTRAIQKVANFLRTSGGVRTANLGDPALARFTLALIRP
jgi:phosphohistidine phosphatase SixA